MKGMGGGYKEGNYYPRAQKGGEAGKAGVKRVSGLRVLSR